MDREKESPRRKEICKLETLAEFGFNRDPFKEFYMETADSLRLKRVMKMAIDSRAMISIIADRGFGKTTTFDLIFREIDVHKINLITADKERVVVSDIEKGLILGLSSESCKRTKEVRARQIRRIMGEASKEKPIVLILEEAHRMHPQTLRALKTLREMDWLGKSPLFTVVMVGQYDPMSKRGVDEVRLRTDSIHMKGITGGEVKEYIRSTVGRHFDPDAMEAVSRLPESRNFLELQEVITNLMRRAIETGQRKVTAIEVFEVYGGGIKEMMRVANISPREMHEQTGLPESTLNMVMNERQGTMTDNKFMSARNAIAEVLRTKIVSEQAPRPGLKAV